MGIRKSSPFFCLNKLIARFVVAKAACGKAGFQLFARNVEIFAERGKIRVKVAQFRVEIGK